MSTISMKHHGDGVGVGPTNQPCIDDFAQVICARSSMQGGLIQAWRVAPQTSLVSMVRHSRQGHCSTVQETVLAGADGYQVLPIGWSVE